MSPAVLFCKEFADEIDARRKQVNIKGIAVTVVKQDGSVETLTKGISSEQGAPVTYDTIFNIGSCSKAFLAMSLAILMNDCSKRRNAKPLPRNLPELTWETKLDDLFPEVWKLKDKWASEKSNIKDLLSHTWGVPRSDNALDPNSDTLDTIKRLQYLKPAYELRERWCYSNIPYIVGAHIISEYSGMPYPTFLQEHLLEPLGMKSTFFPTDESHERLSHAWTAEGRRMPYWLDEKRAALAAGAAAVASSPTDLVKWLKFWINGGAFPGGEKLVSEASFNAMTNAHAIVSGASSNPYESIIGYGMGWQRFSYYAHEIVEHSGLVPGFCAYIAFLPGDSFGIALNCNTYVDPNIIRSIALGLIRRMFGIQERPKIHRNPETKLIGRSNKPDLADVSKDLPLPLKAYTGSYANPGYGGLYLHALTCTTKECRETLLDFSAVEKDKIASSGRLLVGKWERLFSTHIRIVHMDGNLFSFRPAILYPKGYGADSTPFEVNFDFLEGEARTDADMEFECKENRVLGFGIFGYVPNDVLLRNSGSVEEDALVYFSRTSSCSGCSS